MVYKESFFQPVFVIGLFIGLTAGALLGLFALAPVFAGNNAGTCAVPAAVSSSYLPTDIISFLFVQEGTSGSLVHGENGTMILTLSGVPPDTVYFSETPDRFSGGIDTGVFTASSLWNSSGAPNAALMLANAPASNDSVILTLSHPAYDAANATVRYTAVQVPDYTGTGLKAYATFADPSVPEQFGQAMLFIDNADIPVTVINTTEDRNHPDIIITR
ncbi:MAG: hypothetical protein WC367_05940 [Methanoregula sp.]|jgi:hypothetical protein